MLGKKKTTALLLTLTVILAGIVSAAPTNISKLELSHKDGFTVLTVTGSGQIRYAHQSVEAKEGKPFRIVLDCLASRHMLPTKDFTKLPKSIVTSIRTAQYAVDPEEIVRVVLDLSDESVYRVESGQHTLSVYISDPKSSTFAAWASPTGVTPRVTKEKTEATASTVTTTVPQPTAAKKPTSVAKASQAKQAPVPTVTSTSPKPTAMQKPVVTAQKENADQTVKEPEPQAKTVKLPVPDKAFTYGPVPKATAAAEKETAPPVKDEKPTAVATKSTPQPVQSKAETPTVVQKSAPKKEKTPTVANLPVPIQEKQTAQKAATPAKKETPVVASSDNQQVQPPAPGVVPPGSSAAKKEVHKAPPSTVKTGAVDNSVKARTDADKPVEKAAKTKSELPTAPPPVKPKEDVTLASVDTPPAVSEADSQVESRRESLRTKASRYRREAAKTARMKEAEVVQFPQRMVIKYSGGNTRDPFATLVTNDKKTMGAVDLNRVPNIERLNLVGIIDAEKGKDAALMEDMNGIGYILRPGDRVRNGHVAQIDNNAIYFQINEYGWTRTVVKHMEEEN